ncbi:MAG TPA: adenine phosphoribosyltransferase [Gemmatimonadales bacterium]|nr:adenine phosphoribosyltransferase [Gemmatimonadales bacterium]
MSPDLTAVARIRAAIRRIPDYPKPGVLFEDITPLLADAALFREVIEGLAAPFRGAGVTHVVGIEARGFVLGAGVALALGCGFVPFRKAGKLPGERLREEYELEYGRDALEAHRETWVAGSRVLVVDDVLATGGTADAAGRLVRGLHGTLVGWSFLLEIPALGGRARLVGAPLHVLLGG